MRSRPKSFMVIGPTVRELSAIETDVRYGGSENGHLAYSTIGTWAETRRNKLVGPGREWKLYRLKLLGKGGR